MRVPTLVLVLFTALPVGAARPDWVGADQGRVRRDGLDLVFAVATAEGIANPALAASTAQNRALARLATLARQSEAGEDGITLRGTQLYGWAGDGAAHGLAVIAVDDLANAVPASGRDRLRQLVASFAPAGDILPRPTVEDLAVAKGEPPWIHWGCGSYAGKKGRVYFGVGVVAGINNHSLARTTADNRARAGIAKCVEVTLSGPKTFSRQNLWGVMVRNHWFGPEGEVYSLAEVPESMLPTPAAPEPRAVAALDEPAEPAEPGEPDEPKAPEPDPEPLRDCVNRRQGKGMRVAVGVIGPEADLVRGTLETELRIRRFSMTSGAPDGQLIVKVAGQRRGADLDDCLLEVELLRGSETATKTTYACHIRGDQDEPIRVRIDDLREQMRQIRCNIADNLWLAAKQHRVRPKKRKPARARGSSTEATTLYIRASQLATRARYAEALTLLKKCVHAAPAYADCYKSLGVAYLRLGKNPRAKAAYQKYLELRPNAADAGIIQGILRTL